MQTRKWEFARRAGGQVVTSVICIRSHPDPLGIVLWRGKLEFVEVSACTEQHCHLRTSAHYFVGISIEFRTIYRHPFVGDGFPVPRNLETCMGRDGKPVPYDAFTVGPSNSNLSLYLTQIILPCRFPESGIHKAQAQQSRTGFLLSPRPDTPFPASQPWTPD